jgi:hypothetical protein
MDDLSDALCARFDAITSEAIDARAAIDAAVADARSTLAEGIARRRATRRERDAALIAEKRQGIAAAVAAAYADDAINSDSPELVGGARALRERADDAIARAARGDNAAGCIRNCSERVYVAWGEAVLRLLSMLLGVPQPDALASVATAYSSLAEGSAQGGGRDRADTAHDSLN